MKILLLGVGMQGKAALHDLVKNPEVTKVIAADQDMNSLSAYVEDNHFADKVQCEYLDASDPKQLDKLMSQGCDIAIDLLPAVFINDVAAAAVKNGLHLVNTFFITKEIAALSDRAAEKGLTILPEFGLDPGIDLVFLGDGVRNLDTVEEVLSYGSGIPEPEAANNVLKYKVTWTFEGVLNSYFRSSVILRDGKYVEIDRREIFSPENVHAVEIEGLGRLEAYPNGDIVQYTGMLGIDPSKLRSMGRYTLRWPGHCDLWKKLVDLHLLDDEPVRIKGIEIPRREFLSKAIEPHIRLSQDERDIALIRVEIMGKKNDEAVKQVYQLLDKRDLSTGLTAMSRSVGFTASLGASLIGSGKIHQRGVLSPIRDIPYNLIAAELEKRDIDITRHTIMLNGSLPG